MKETGHRPERVAPAGAAAPAGAVPRAETVPQAEAVAPPAAGPDPARRRWLILAVIGVAQLMVVLDATIVNIALPSAQRALGFSVTDRQWVITAYALAFGGLLVVGGRLSDLGRKRTFTTGLGGFAVASAAGGAAQTFAELIAARAVQGASGAIVTSAFSLGPAGARPADSGVAAALVNSSNQIGGSLGAGLLNTIAASAAANYLTAHAPHASLLAATVHGDVIAFTFLIVLFAVGAVVVVGSVCVMSLRA